jgi:uncharacterized protein
VTRRQTLNFTPDELLEFEQDPVRALGLEPTCAVRVLKKSMDARHRRVRFMLQIEIVYQGAVPAPQGPALRSPSVGTAVVVGAGPAGLFAALSLLESGVKPVVLDQGQGFPERHLAVRDVRMWGKLEEGAPLTSGLGGAGTYSDGKLHTRRKGQGCARALELFSYFARDPGLLSETYPHVGSNRLPAVVDGMRRTIEDAGGTVRFGAKVLQLQCAGNKVTGVVLTDGEVVEGDAVVLAGGNSARGLFEACKKQRVSMESKAFAIGVRVEHSRQFIDRTQLGTFAGHPVCGAARYALAFQVSGRGVYTFCMCPGGYVIPTPPEPGHLAVNGMSFSTRSSRWSNAALVVAVSPADYGLRLLDGVALQRAIEKACFEVAGDYRAPAQQASAFAGADVAGIPESSYRPGVQETDLAQLLPPYVVDALRQGLHLANLKIPGFLSDEALLLAPETLTSSPVRIHRGKEGVSPSHPGLFPCGEGSGWSGGITSSAADGLDCGTKVAAWLEGSE